MINNRQDALDALKKIQQPEPASPPQQPQMAAQPTVATMTQPQAGPSSALIKIGENMFEMDANRNIRPYGDKPTFDQQQIAASLREMLQFLPTPGGQVDPSHIATYAPLTGSNVYFGVYTVDPQKWTTTLLDNLQPGYTPNEIQPHPSEPGWWILSNPETGADEIYKTGQGPSEAEEGDEDK